MHNDPLEREREFRQQIENAARNQRAARIRRSRPWLEWLEVIGSFLSKHLWLPLILFVLLVTAGFFFLLFGLAIKWTNVYACSLQQARSSPMVIAELGEPIEAGFFAWSFSYRQEGAITDTSFYTTLTGPKGEGTLNVQWYGSPVGSSVLMNLDKNGLKHKVYSGPIPCR